MDVVWGLVAEGLVRTPGVVLLEPFVESGFEGGQGAVFVEIDFFVFDAAPESFDEDVVHVSASAVHADGNAEGGEFLCPFLGGELAALVGIEDVGQVVALGCCVC
jgi:hypothetical protein